MNNTVDGPVSEDTDQLRPAELRLLDAVRRSETLDFLNYPWDNKEENLDKRARRSRTIRGEIVRRLLKYGHSDGPAEYVHILGAFIDGVIDISNSVIFPGFGLRFCKEVSLKANFSQFIGETFFDDNEFKYAGFGRATLIRTATFDNTTFTDEADFTSTSFTKSAGFSGAKFLCHANFGKAQFMRFANFHGATFEKPSHFTETMFHNYTSFNNAHFTRNSNFSSAIFKDRSSFKRTTFIEDVSFSKATFEKDISFDGLIAREMSLESSQIHSEQFDTFAAENLHFDQTKFHERISFTACCRSVSAQNAQFILGGHMEIRGATMDLHRAEFLTRTIITDPGQSRFDDKFFENSAGFDRLHLVDDLIKARDRKTSIVNIDSANVETLVLSSVSLRDCRFHGAHGLDGLRIDSSCDLATSETLPKRWHIPNSRRRIIAEEIYFRTDNLQTPKPIPALDISAIYRDLRRGLETAKNEPGAADFYYGEMEMRRHSGAETSHAERGLLWLYWAVSGYGLRAWRAFAMIGLVILCAGTIFAIGGIAEPRDTGDAYELAIRNSVALLRNPGDRIELTPIGTVTDIALRLLTPVLLGLALLALRGRTKR